ncbi:MAG: sulfur oxidation c-type cytochrome SoxX [Gammaproteobacteria bacterium]|nr:sulfur oxidation c-type cytochrome SoxX [Gammaproteobacteria bacterium]
MQKTAKNPRVTVGALVIMLGSFAIAPGVASAAEMSAVEEGKKIAFHRKKGNCLACHKIAGGSLAGNIGPALVNMKARFADKAKLRAKIYDATASSPNTIMPPFGKHKILTKSELDKVVEFIYTL